MKFLSSLVEGFNSKDVLEDMLELLKITKDEATCEQILSLLRTFVGDETKFYKMIGLEDAASVPDEPNPEDGSPPGWI